MDESGQAKGFAFVEFVNATGSQCIRVCMYVCMEMNLHTILILCIHSCCRCCEATERKGSDGKKVKSRFC